MAGVYVITCASLTSRQLPRKIIYHDKKPAADSNNSTIIDIDTCYEKPEQHDCRYIVLCLGHVLASTIVLYISMSSAFDYCEEKQPHSYLCTSAEPCKNFHLQHDEPAAINQLFFIAMFGLACILNVKCKYDLLKKARDFNISEDTKLFDRIVESDRIKSCLTFERVSTALDQMLDGNITSNCLKVQLKMCQ